MSPTLSVVMPARNEEALVRAALESCLAQQVPLEAILVDNASADATSAVASDVAARHPELAFRLAHEPRVGRARAKNTGARVARGDVVLFLDADSRMAPDLGRRVVARYAAGERAADVRIEAAGDDLFDRAFFRVMDLKRLFGIRAQMFFCDRALFLARGGFDETLELAEDREFLVRLARSGTRVTHLGESYIATSPRRLRRLPLRLSMFALFGRWALANAGIGRRWRY